MLSRIFQRFHFILSEEWILKALYYWTFPINDYWFVYILINSRNPIYNFFPIIVFDFNHSQGLLEAPYLKLQNP